MARNIEIKIQVEELGSVHAKAAKIADGGPFELIQVDYFFPVKNGRLKLRMEESDLPDRKRKAELIAYSRSDQAEARASDYLLYPTSDPDLLRESLSRAMGSGPVVRKKRVLFLSGRTRIHLDSVDKLGTFVEIEVVMDEHEKEAEGYAELQKILEQLKLQDGTIMEQAYADLLA